jgi:tetratricopeptide (TPR) repeat protein
MSRTLRRPVLHLALAGIGLSTVLIAVPCASPLQAAPKPARKAAPARKPASGKASKAKPTPKAPEGAGFSVDDHPLVQALTQVNSGPGVLVCEPVGKLAGAETTAFGAGCARWLHLVVGGHGELGKTPLWSSLYHTQLELGRKDLRLTVTDGARLRQSLGITHAAFGEIQGDAARCTLTYRLWDLAAKKPVGEPVRLSGSEVEVRAALPGAATQLTRALGVPEPRVPSGVGETAAELRFLGSLRWHPVQLNEAQTQQLTELATATGEAITSRPQPPVLAAFFSLLQAASLRQGPRVLQLARELATRLPENALLFGDLGRMALASDVDSFAARTGNVEIVDTPAGKRAFSRDTPKLPFVPLKALLERFPNNYLFNSSQAYIHLVGKRHNEARQVAEQMVRCARANSDAWLQLSHAISEQADAIRNARTINQLTEAELQASSKYYEEWLPMSLKAVQVNPRYGRAWLDTSSAAAFLGVEELADSAYGRAIALAPGEYSVLWWGLEMYQPKWYPNANKLKFVADAALKAAPTFSDEERLDLAKSMQHGGLGKLAEKLVRRPEDLETLKKHGTHVGEEH